MLQNPPPDVAAIQNQIAALKELLTLFNMTRLQEVPYGFLSPDEIRRKLTGTETMEDKDPGDRYQRWQGKVKTARKNLLLSGFNPPDSWLAVVTAPTIHLTEKTSPKEPQKIASVEPMDRTPLNTAMREIKAAILRLEVSMEMAAMGKPAAAGEADGAGRGDTPAKTPKLSNGPHEPDVFAWKGKQIRLQHVPFRLLNCVWHAPRRQIQIDDALQDVWNREVSSDAIKAAVKKVNRTFEKAGYPKSLSQKQGYFVLS